MLRHTTTSVAALLLALAAACATTEPAPKPETALAPSADRGRVVYRRACATCHGVRGDGRGPGGEGLDVEPRDFTRGVYAYRSTPTGSLPVDGDLIRTVENGLPGTTMPAWRDVLSKQEILDVVAHVKSFSPRFGNEEIDEPIAVPEPVPFTAESVARGKAAYEKVQCGKCHGEKGRGDGWARADEMKDDRGRVVHARDFTKGIYRSGRTRQDLWRVFYTGLDGTPMPAYETSLPPEDIHHLVNYMLSLEQKRGLRYWLTTPPKWFEPAEQAVQR